MSRLRRFPLLFLVTAIILMTPIGVFTCGSLAPSMVFVRGDDILPRPCPEAKVQLTETAVTAYLSTPFMVEGQPILMAFVFLLLAVAGSLPPTSVAKRKPPTPPPNYTF